MSVNPNEFDPVALQQYLQQHIPITRALGVSVNQCSAGLVELMAPLSVNLNHKSTAFGGSLSVMGITAGWSLVFMNLLNTTNEIVIQESNVKYLKAVTDDFVAISRVDEAIKWHTFIKTYEKRGKARITVHSQILCQNELAAEFTGTYVAFKLD